MYADLDAMIGHMAIVPVTARRENGQWTTVLLSGESGIELPATWDATPVEK